MSILIDDRAGSGPRTITRKSKTTGKLYTKYYPGLMEYPPLNICQDCGKTLIWRTNKKNGDKYQECPSNSNHSTLTVLCELDSADVCIQGNGPTGKVLIGIEVKSIHDLLSSAATGRLQATQIPNMLASYDIRYLLYYGLYRSSSIGGLQILRGSETKPKWVNEVTRAKKSKKDKNSGDDTPKILPYKYLTHFLLSLAETGVRVIHANDMADAAAWVASIYSWRSKPYDKHRSFHTFDNSQSVSLLPGLDPCIHQCASVAIKLPGLGFERALVVARYFDGSIIDMVNAPTSEWERIPGIGRVIAKTVTTALRTKTDKVTDKVTSKTTVKTTGKAAV